MLLDGACRHHPNRPKTFARNPLSTAPYHTKLRMFLFTAKGRSPAESGSYEEEDSWRTSENFHKAKFRKSGFSEFQVLHRPGP
jgi:hypothetical protein